MKIVLDIDKDYYEVIKHDVKVNHNDFKPYTIIANGTPLPKGHGGLITKKQAIELVEFYQNNPQHFGFVDLIEDIKGEKPIIEAEGETE